MYSDDVLLNEITDLEEKVETLLGEVKRLRLLIKELEYELGVARNSHDREK